jgi:Flp pilus assembly protein TadD
MKKLGATFALVLGFLISSPVWAAGSDAVKDHNVDPRYEMAKKAIGTQDYGQALPILEQIVAADPADADAWNYLGFSLRKLGRMDQAQTAYKKALAANPDHLGANEYLGELYVETGRMDLAKERLKRLDKLCFFGCDEYDDLKEMIEKAGG